MTPRYDRSVWLAHNILPHEPALRSWLRRRTVAGLELDDIVQETYAVLAGLAAVDHIESPRAYAFQTAQSLVLRHLRRTRVVRIDALAETDIAEVVADQPSPEAVAAWREELSDVAAVIETLPAKRREAFRLRKFEGLSQREVAQRMGISESTVEKHIGQALRTLMDAFKSETEPSSRRGVGDTNSDVEGGLEG